MEEAYELEGREQHESTAMLLGRLAPRFSDPDEQRKQEKSALLRP